MEIDASGAGVECFDHVGGKAERVKLRHRVAVAAIPAMSGGARAAQCC